VYQHESNHLGKIAYKIRKITIQMSASRPNFPEEPFLLKFLPPSFLPSFFKAYKTSVLQKIGKLSLPDLAAARQ
jgi:hypothetical protein